MKRRGLWLNIFVYMLGFSVLMLLILWLFQTVFLGGFYRAVKLGQLERQAAALAGYVREDNLEALAQAVQQRGDMSVELVDEDGEIYTVPGLFPEAGPSALPKTQAAQLFRLVDENGGALTISPDTLGGADGQEPPAPEGAEPPALEPGFSPGRRMDERIVYAEIVTVEKTGTRLLLLLNAMTAPVNATVETLRIQLLYISGIMLVLAVAIALLLARRVAAPIARLNADARQLTQEHPVAFEGGGYREIGELAATLSRVSEELAKTEALRRELVANVSHDLRTPLTLIAGYAEMMRDLPGEATTENLQTIIDEAGRLSALVEELLDLSRIQAGTAGLCPAPFRLAEEVRDIIARFQKLGGPGGYTVSFRGEDGIRVNADARRIGQVVYNFLLNAMEHGGADKVIEVSVTAANGRARVEVADHGEGIRPEDLPHIWERYFKAEGGATHRRDGSGLGLSIARGILGQHPGAQYGASSQPGQGSVFWFSLPQVPPQGQG